MHAVMKVKPEIGAVLVEKDIPVPKEKEVLLQIKLAAICGTDLHIYRWDNWAANANLLIPGIIGHECVGEVVQIGSQVTTLQIGDRVSVETHIPCGECHLCKTDRQHICENLLLFGLHTDGCFAEYSVVPAVCARKIPDSIPDQIAAVLEPLGVGVHASEISEAKGKRVAVLGAGPIGLFAASAALAMGAESVTISDVQQHRLLTASKCGDFLTWNPAEQKASSVLSGMYSPDIIIESTGNERAIKEALPTLRKGGTVVLAGLFAQEVAFNLSKDVVFKEATLRGIHGRRMWSTWDLMEGLLQTDKLTIAPALTHTFTLAEYEYAFQTAISGEGVKVLLSPNH